MQITSVGAGEGTTYSMEGGLVVHDKTEGVVRVIFEDFSTFRAKYHLFIGDVKIVSSAMHERYFNKIEMATVKTLSLKGKQTLTFQNEGELIHIKGAKTPIYVDLSAPIRSYSLDPQEKGEVLAYKCTNYRPRDINALEAAQILARFQERLSLFQIKVTLYNRHGVALLGKGNSFYWANPDQDQLFRRDAEIIENELMTYVKTKSLKFENSVFGCFMNNEPAIELYPNNLQG